MKLTKFEFDFTKEINEVHKYFINNYWIVSQKITEVESKINTEILTKVDNEIKLNTFESIESKKEFVFNVIRFMNLLRDLATGPFMTSATNDLLLKFMPLFKINETTSGYIVLHQYILTCFYRSLNDMIVTNADEFDPEFYADLIVLSKRIRILMQNDLKLYITKKGISINLNKFVGFDTEYEALDHNKKTNKLISSQLVANTNCYIKIPKTDGFTLEQNSLNKWLSGLTFDLNNNQLLKKLFEENINHIRTVNCERNDIFYKDLLNKFKVLAEVNEVFIYTNKDHYLITTKKSDRSEIFKVLNNYSSSDLLNDINSLRENDFETLLNYLFKIMCDLRDCKNSKIFSSIKKILSKQQSRVTYILDSNKLSKLNISIFKDTYLCLHESAADLSMLSDFDVIKNKLDIVKRSFVTRGKPIKDLFIERLETINGKEVATEFLFDSRLIIRDTALIAPGGVKSLAAIGNIYGSEFKKIDIGAYRQGRMSDLLTDNPTLFKEYALRDSYITLKHCNTMEDFYCTVGKSGIPLTLSGLGKNYVLKEWDAVNYKGYQVRKDIDLINIGEKLSPKNLRSMDAMEKFVKFTKSYRGGRNESFMYGEASQQKWFDYDLTSAYTTVMSILGDPNYKALRKLNYKDFLKFKNDSNFLIYNYIVAEIDFKFPEETKYPCIPTFVDNDTDAYVLEGSSIVTGPELLVAINMGCEIKFKEGFVIPFKLIKDNNLEENKIVSKDTENNESLEIITNVINEIETLEYETNNIEGFSSLEYSTESTLDIEKMALKYENDLDYKTFVDSSGNSLFEPYESPFKNIIKGLQQKRRMHPKKTFYNYMYKEIGNSIYGQTAMGLSCKTAFDTKTNSYVRVKGSELSNPILASYITGFTRAVVSECLNNISIINGKVISVTTDGFITNVEDLENKIINSENEKVFYPCLEAYRKVRGDLTTFEGVEKDNNALEIKLSDDKEILTWKTRGQLAISPNSISAITGFQKTGLDLDYLYKQFKEVMFNSKSKTIEFVQSRLLSASDIYKKGGQMQMAFRDQNFNLGYDNKREIIRNDDFLIESKPWKTVKDLKAIRILKKALNTPVFGKFLETSNKGYKNLSEIAIRNFIKILLNKDLRAVYNIPENCLLNSKEIIKFVKEYNKTVFPKVLLGLWPSKITKIDFKYIANIKYRESVTRTVPRNKETLDFIEFVKNKYNYFNDDLFFKEQSQLVIKQNKTKQN